MFATLPDFTPRDSHSLWFASSLAPSPPPPPPQPHDGRHASAVGQATRSSRDQMMGRTALARLQVDEQAVLQRRTHVQNFGSAWLKPPGVLKTLQQMREERREYEEHQEAVRREQLARELAEAEAVGVPDDDIMDDVQLDGARDLDDDVPTADDHFAMDEDDEDDDVDVDIDDDDEEEDGDDDAEEGEDDEAQRQEDRQNDLVAARMRMADDAFREALVRGNADAVDMYDGDIEQQAAQGQMLDEDDFAAQPHDMNRDLDDDIPEAESGAYEHTDSEASVSTTDGGGGGGEEDDDDNDLAHHHHHRPPLSASRPGLLRSPTMPRRATPIAPRATNLDMLLLSQDGTSFVTSDGSSPAQSRRA
ncbi:hypothetical protein CP532_3634 [Ophiocordyceps camponoti-leonardi (nom. inval.)]|nr:hypothetical protein CP532_3634 [Ophiocordyceps camponoti-leonardi (nom. inval.)]